MKVRRTVGAVSVHRAKMARKRRERADDRVSSRSVKMAADRTHQYGRYGSSRLNLRGYPWRSGLIGTSKYLPREEDDRHGGVGRRGRLPAFAG